jgi:acyl-CoA synthetase (NDP forming)
VGGVALALEDTDSAVAALERMVRRLGDGEYVLEEMDRSRDGVELIVGAQRDRAFGPLVLVGLGGVQAELYGDVARALAPVTSDQARRLIESLRGARQLAGWRGATPVDVAAAADVVAAVSRLIATQPEVMECEINPLRVTPSGAVALDALVVVTVGAPSFVHAEDIDGSQPALTVSAPRVSEPRA